MRGQNFLETERQEFAQKLDESGDFAEIFELVKEAVEKSLKRSRAGLMLGLANLGGSAAYFLGAYHFLDSNMIVLNTFPIMRLQQTNPGLLKPYLFQLLLHEYLHSLDFVDEKTVRRLTAKICAKTFGKNHAVAEIAKNIHKFLPALAFAEFGWFPKNEPQIFIVQGFDKGNLTYVA